MSPQLMKVLRYWRASLADGVLGKGQFSHRDRAKYISLPAEVLKSGMLPQNLVERIFSGQDEKVKEVSVRFWPLVTARRTSHAAQTASRLPELVAPVVTEAKVWRDGTINPIQNAIARDVLTPLPQGEFSVGTVEALDNFLTVSPLVESMNVDAWQEYLSHCRKMIDAVASGWPSNDANYDPIGSGLMEVARTASATVRQILDLYDLLLDEEPDVPLLAQLALPDSSKKASSHARTGGFTNPLGHSNDQFPMADQQRDVLVHLANAGSSQILAVNGPPGTGKTTMLLSAIAGQWVQAALADGMPPVIVAASSNNQAVTNIIDAFGKDFALGEGPFSGRWLPDLKSFGMFLASFSREAIATKTYQTETFFNGIESEDYVMRAKGAYLTAAQQAFPSLDDPDVEGVVAALRGLMQKEVFKLSGIDEARTDLERHQTAASQELGNDPTSFVDGLTKTEAQCVVAHEDLSGQMKAWDRHQASESGLLAFFGFFPSIARKRHLRARVALEDAGCELNLSKSRSLADIDITLRAAVKAGSKARHKASSELAHAVRLLDVLRASEQKWEKAVSDLGAQPSPVSDLQDLQRFADCNIRFRLFLLATHYWEGRWLMAMEDDLPGIVRDQKKTGRAKVLPRWQRRMMLTPCAVSTFATLPGKLTYSTFSGGNFVKQYLLNFIDLLIVDEAGQVLPEVAAASFALAKRALVIGDTQQIEPISSVPKPVDIGNLQDCDLLPPTFSEEDLSAISSRGLCTVGGSAMRLAQEAFGANPYPDMEKGLYLFEHRRCYDEIISYCNALCYKGTLRPKRGGVPDENGFPVMGYLHIDGIAISHGGSRSNPVEAQTIAAWLAANRDDLETRYSQKLEKIVGVVTPFGRQAGEISNACAAQGIQVAGRQGMTIGTVHSLQGAERAVVIFSPVYSKHADGQFIDMSPSMLNVTVSRAKDNFLVFGDMDVFSAAPIGSPRALLAEFLFRSEDNMLDFEVAPRRDLEAGSQQLLTLSDAAEHDAFILKALASGGEHYMIVSPWVIVATMKRAGLLEAFSSAVARGATIEVFTDPQLNEARKKNGMSNLEAAAEIFADIGVTLHTVRQVHSKILVMDNELLCIGSYNWLSADRHGKYARHETSFVYLGAQLQDEIETITASLEGRETH
ncbi:putative DNA helicase-like protein [Octadecabacter antarcticus 307]|uniref:Phospholipase D n=2 Tax=Octadecabacter TaxID=53945 RepID=M9R5U4_9RHOB|nr:putative DNA helicase-like protein [Octadecabacter antarcticus 307]